MDVSGLCLQSTTITRWDCFHLLANVVLFQELTRNFHSDLMTCSEERAEATRVRACLLLLNPHLLLSPELLLSPKLCLSSCLLLLDPDLFLSPDFLLTSGLLLLNPDLLLSPDLFQSPNLLLSLLLSSLSTKCLRDECYNSRSKNREDPCNKSGLTVGGRTGYRGYSGFNLSAKS